MSYIIRVKSQINDVFSEFRKYIAPTYYHDRCERSLHMHLYVMHKREILLALAGFLSTFILLLFIGLAGPNVAKLDSIKATDMFRSSNINQSLGETMLPTGPFSLITPQLSTYSQQLCLWVTFKLKNEEESEAFHKDFAVAVKIDGFDEVNSKKNSISLQNSRKDMDVGRGQRHHLYCSGKECIPIELLHLEYLKYIYYQINMSFDEMESVHEKYVIEDIEFTFQSINQSFTTLSIWFRFVFLVIAFATTCWFTHSLHRYSFSDWSMEQKWITLLLILLLLYNNPLYPMIFLMDSSFPRILDILFRTTFFCNLLLFWICFFHGIRQNNRSITRFYGPKILVTGCIWFSVIYASAWSCLSKLKNPTIDELAAYEATGFLKMLSFIFYVSLIGYIVYLCSLLLSAFTELKAMPYFDLRLKLQTFMIIFTMTISILVVLLSTSSPSESGSSTIGESNISKVPFLQLLPWTYQISSPASFLSIYSISNLYICICTYFYFPSTASLMDSKIVRDNPTLSMINDSDEDVIYGSDTEQPLNQSKLIETKNDDEESD